MSPSLPSLAKLDLSLHHLKRPLFFNTEMKLSFKDKKIQLYLDINAQDIVKDIGIEATGFDKDYLELFCLYLLGKSTSELKRVSETLFLKEVAIEDREKLSILFPLINPIFLVLEKAIEKYEGSDLAIQKLSLTQNDLLCRCENRTRREFLDSLYMNAGSFSKAMASLNLAATCGSCFKDSEKIYEDYLLSSCFLEEKSYADWVLDIDDFLKKRCLREEKFFDYTFELLSFEKLLLKIRVKRGEFELGRKELTEIISSWVHTEMHELIRISLIF